MSAKWKKRIMAFVLICGMLGGTVTEVWAATRPINSVSISVNSRLEPGSGLPAIEIGSGSPETGGIMVSANNGKYHVSKAEWIDKASVELKAADEPRMKVTLAVEDVSSDYFLASYKESNVKVSGGTFVSARREGDDLVVTLRVRGVKGKYDPPKDAFWNEKNLGEARWEKPENTSGYYEVQLYRNGKSVYKIPQTSALKYQFYPYMTKEGNYTFKIRTIPVKDIQVKYGKKSEWLESGELQITDRYVSDGKGQLNSDNKVVKGTEDIVGWFQEDGGWRYRYPDGSLCRAKWEYIEGQWYYFNMDGLMLTGWQKIDNYDYYLHQNGQMAVGWTNIDGKWYYFLLNAENGHPAGTMVNGGWRIIGSYYYYFNQDGSLYTGWLNQNGKWYYLNTVENSLQGAMFTGWIHRDDRTYFTNSNGEMMEGWCEIDGNWYYFYPGSGEMARNVSINGFYLNQDGIWNQG